MSDPLPRLVLLAGGLGTRLKAISQNLPKAMVPVAGHPFIYHQLKRLKQAGFNQIVICAGYQCEPLEEYLTSKNPFAQDFIFSFDGDELLGTGGALAKAVQFVDDCFFVMYGDTLLSVDYQQVWTYYQEHQPSCAGVMTVLKNRNQWDKSNTCFSNGRVWKYSKRHPDPEMAYIDYGASLLKKETFQKWCREQSGATFDLAGYFSFLASSDLLLGWEAQVRFYEIGTPESLQETENMLLKGK